MIKHLLLFLMFLLTTVPVLADMRYEGDDTIWKDTVWEGDILIDGILTVAPGVTLELRPGTTVRFTRFDSNNDQIGEHELFIQGRFIARGTLEQPILFTSAEDNPTSGDWGAINMMASMSENLLEYCRVEFAYRGFHAHFGRARLDHSVFVNNRRGAQFQESDVQIDSCTFVDNLNGIQFRDSTVNIVSSEIRDSYWGMRSVNSDVMLADTLIANNRINGINFRESRVELDQVTIRNNRRGLYLQRTSGTVARSRLVGNSEHGLFVEDSTVSVSSTLIADNGRAGVRVIDAGLTLLNSQIEGNDLYAVINDGDTNLEIEGNWWGTTDHTKLDSLLRDGKDRSGLGLITIHKPLATLPAWAE